MPKTLRILDLDCSRPAGRPGPRDGRFASRRANQCHVAGGRSRLHLRAGLPLLQQIHRGQSSDPRRPARHSRRTPGKRPRLCSHQQVGGLRTSLRRHRRARTSGRSGAGGAIRISSRNLVDTGRRGLRRLRAGFRDSAVLGAARRQVAHRNGARRNWTPRRTGGLRRRDQHHRDPARGLRPGRGERAQGQSVGHVHHRDDDSHRAADGRVSAHPAARQSAGDIGARICPGDARDLGRTVGLADRVGGALVHLLGPGAGDSDHHLRIRRFGAAGLAAAGAARLPEHVREAGNHLTAGARNRRAPSHPAHAAAHSLH